jgi:flagellin-like hook-associated protein FlgL
MRITEQILIKNLLTSIERTRDRMTTTQQQLSTGKKINSLSDDPLNVHKALRLRELKATNERFQENVQDSINLLSSLTEEMTIISDIVGRVKDFGVQGSIPTADEEGRNALALQIDQMLQELVDQANTTFIGKSIFGGVQTIETPYEIIRENLSETLDIPSDDGIHRLFLDNTRLVRGSVRVTDETGATTFAEGTDYTVDLVDGIVTIPGSQTFDIPPRANFQADGTHQISFDKSRFLLNSLRVTDETGATTFVEGTDYTIDRVNGIVTILDSGTIPSNSRIVLRSGTIPSNSRIVVTYDTQGVGDVRERFPEDIAGEINRGIAEDTELTVNISGREIFGSPGDPDRVDIFRLFRRLKNELQRDNIEGIQDTFDDLDDALAQVTAVATETGTELIRMSLLDDRLENENVSLAARLSSIEDVDIAQAAVEFQAEQAALQAALAIGARLVQPSLISFLR